MGITGLALPWQITMARQRACSDSIGATQEKRPEILLSGTDDPANSAARSADALRLAETRAADSALAAACRSGGENQNHRECAEKRSSHAHPSRQAPIDKSRMLCRLVCIMLTPCRLRV